MALLVVIVLGTLGFMLIEHYEPLEAFFMTIITISTVGYEVIHEMSPAGMIFTSVLIVSSFGIFAFALTTFTQFIFDGEIRNYLKYRALNKKIQKLENHVIVCGFGRNGKQATYDLLHHKEKVLVIEHDAELMEREYNLGALNRNNFLYLIGDATRDAVLEMAQLPRAKALITALPSDADNLFVILTAREINQSAILISRASGDHSDSKLKRAGANNVIMPDKVGGTRMAKLVTEPDVVEFIENILLRNDTKVNLEEIACDEMKNCFVNKTIGELNIRSKSGANLIGLKKPDRSYIFNPSPDLILKSDYKLFALGTPEQIYKLKMILFGNRF